MLYYSPFVAVVVGVTLIYGYLFASTVIAKPLNRGNLRNNRIRNPVEIDSNSNIWNDDDQNGEERSNEYIELYEYLDTDDGLFEMEQAFEAGDVLDFSMKSDIPSSFPSSSDVLSLIPSESPSSVPSMIDSIAPTPPDITTITSDFTGSPSSSLQPSTDPPTMSSSTTSSTTSSITSSTASSSTSSTTSSSNSTVDFAVPELASFSPTPTVDSSPSPTKAFSFSPSSTPAVSNLPSSSPSLGDCLITPKERAVQIYKFLDDAGNKTLIRDLGTPQGLAAEWLINQDFSRVCPDKKVVQRWVMAVFYYATNGDDWLQCSLDGSDKCGSNPPFNSKQRFLSDISECDWAGITCNMDDCVTRIEFESNNITGTIATEIGLLKDLVFLGMEDGGLTSTIPTELGGLTNLSIIDFDYNELSGSIPAQLYLLTDLVQLDLNDNELTGNIDDIGVFLDLEFLQLQNNQFTGTIPDDIMGDLSRMRVLNLHGNKLDTTQAMPESVCARLFENGGFLTSLIVDCGITCSCCTSCLDNE